LVEDFKNLYETKERYDTIITVGKEPNVETIHAHSVILCTRSSYFRRALSDEWAEKKNVDLNSQKDEIILELLVAADELLIQKLIDFIQEFLIKNSCKFLQQSPIKMVHFITHNKRFNELNEAYLETICEKPKLLFDSEEFLSLEEDALKLIIKCDNLDMKECDIWRKMVEWGTIQHTTSEKGPDLCVPNNSSIWKLKTKSYPKFVNINSLTVLDYEVFQVVSNVTEKST
ncbi:2242_t:CDS:2, partial [Gigaspora margarita]